jgi:hypothetical protein
MFSIHLIDKQKNEIKTLCNNIKKEIMACSVQSDYEEVLNNYLEIEISQMTKRHSYELATVIKVEENESNLRILYSFNVVHLRTFIEKVLMKREIRLEERREIRRVRLNLKTNLEMNQDGNELIITH